MQETQKKSSDFIWTGQVFKPDTLTPKDVLAMYEEGCFPMAGYFEDPDIAVMYCDPRAVFPLDAPQFSKSLRKKVLKEEFEIRINTAFTAVMDGCAEITRKRENTWIDATIKSVFNDLHKMGHAHSVEAWKDGELVGGLYGIQIRSAFCGESMFSRATDASKVALVHLSARLWKNGFTMLDAQALNDHLVSLGVQPIEPLEYLMRLSEAQAKNPSFTSDKTDERTLVREYLHAHP